MNKRLAHSFLYIIFFISGFTSLIYEIVWFKLLQYLFGSTVYSLSTLLASFMGGLAIGSYLIGHFLLKKKSPLLFYAIIEIFIGAYAIAFPYLFQLIENTYLHLNYPPHSFYSLLSRVVLSFLILGLPTIAMGGTLPAMAKFFIHSPHNSSKKLGFLYAVNTFGACAGCLIAGFFMIEYAGIHYSLLLTALLNVTIGVLTIFIIRKLTQSDKTTPELNEKQEQVFNTHAVHPLKLLIIFAITGASALAYEIIFTRLFALITLNTVHAFSIILSAFLTGIAIGSFIISFRVDSINKKYFLLAILQGLLALLTFTVFYYYPHVFTLSYAIDNYYHGSWFTIVSLKFLLFFIILLPITIISGAFFPLIAKAIINNIKAVSKQVGLIYFYNTAGAIIGSLLCGFLLLPALGISSTFVLLIAVNLMIASYLFFLEIKLSKFLKYCLVLLCWLAAIILPHLAKDPVQSIAESKIPEDSLLLFFKDGVDISAMITLNPKDNSKLLFQNNEWVANTKAPGHKIFGHIPLFLASSPEDVLVVGLGSGITAKSVSLHPSIKTIDIAEISEVTTQGIGFFSRDNNDILNNPRRHLYLDDVRHFLQKSNIVGADPRVRPQRHKGSINKYDMILHEPLQQWTAGTVNLYTQEYYRLCKTHLKENGMISQWVQLNTLSVNDLKMIVRTFLSVFPNSSGWLVGKELYLLGKNGASVPVLDDILPQTISLGLESQKNSLDKAWQDALSDPYDSPWENSSPLDIFAFYFMNNHELNELSKDAALITDDKPAMEYSVARSIYMISQVESINFLLSRKKCDQPPNHFTFALDTLYNQWNTICSSHLLFYQGLIALQNKNESSALQYWKQAIEIRPQDRTIQKALAELLVKKGDEARSSGSPETAYRFYQQALQSCPYYYSALIKTGELFELNNRQKEAEQYYQEAIQHRPSLPEAYNHLGILYSRHSFTTSQSYFKEAIALARYNQIYHHNFALLYNKYGYSKQAVKIWNETIKINPQSKLSATIKELLNK
ncbi:MAG: hypothetical protein A2Y62_09000 [Candidatus Fischerbacteria bacterium RBG_13_37_8]|uniref:Major facilitator superfamily (MFS) profile domain-containing protein n=1 Tax=Candidatus Fischerbacteria bacterium RBG_13_37_8 TaxID=1817863 RepID=A0A1F5VUX7_9BACT|nr:MAG: hypothetical protein A2Y62_09000 [Candidatus Fischerbacteria bacterium RBG_13_37_8]